MAEAIFNKLKGFFQELGHPVSLKDIPQVSEQVLQEGVKAVMKNPSKLANAPRPVPLEQAESILNRILRD
jgi:alcohol dehydrogenase class IV